MMKLKTIPTLLMMTLLLAGCGGQGKNARDLLGLGRKTPDEFKVVSRPPLTIPPDFTLRPPTEGEDYTAQPAADSAARALVTGKDETDILGTKRMMGEAETAVGVVNSFELPSSADDNFLGNIGAEQADSSIRTRLAQEMNAALAAEKAEKESGFGWLKPAKADDSETIVDAEAEKARLQANKKTGKKLTEGETPTIAPKPKSILEDIF
jgi:hypothetical protein